MRSDVRVGRTAEGMAMNQARVGLLVAAALLAVPATAVAQPKTAKAAAGKKDAGKKDNKPIDLDAPEKPKEEPPPIAPVEAPAGGDDGGALGDICKIDPGACPVLDMDKAAARDLKAQMYAVQQIYALRRHRFEVSPYMGLTLNDQFVAHNGPGLSLNFYITNVLAIGVNGNYFTNSPSAFNLQTSRAGRVGQPINEYQWNANLNITYVPAYGKFAGFGDFIFHYDAFILGGGGAISTRPIPTIDPDYRTFNFKPKANGHVGAGFRIFFNRWLAAVLEVSDYIYMEELENPKIAGTAAGQADTNTWLGASSLTNNVQAQVGLSVFLPFTWEYRLPK